MEGKKWSEQKGRHEPPAGFSPLEWKSNLKAAAASSYFSVDIVFTRIGMSVRCLWNTKLLYTPLCVAVIRHKEDQTRWVDGAGGQEIRQGEVFVCKHDRKTLILLCSELPCTTSVLRVINITKSFLRAAGQSFPVGCAELKMCFSGSAVKPLLLSAWRVFVLECLFCSTTGKGIWAIKQAAPWVIYSSFLWHSFLLSGTTEWVCWQGLHCSCILGTHSRVFHVNLGQSTTTREFILNLKRFLYNSKERFSFLKTEASAWIPVVQVKTLTATLQ